MGVWDKTAAGKAEQGHKMREKKRAKKNVNTMAMNSNEWTGKKKNGSEQVRGYKEKTLHTAIYVLIVVN